MHAQDAERPMTRGFLGLDRRGWPGTIAVALVAAAVAVGLPILNDMVSAERAIPAGTVLEVGRGASFTAADGWSLDAEKTDPATATVLIDKGALSLVVQAVPSTRPLEEEYARLADEIRRGNGVQLFNDATTFTTDSGLTGIAGSYAGPESEGRFAVLRTGDAAIRLLAKGPPDAMASGLDDVERMVQTLRVDQP